MRKNYANNFNNVLRLSLFIARKLVNGTPRKGRRPSRTVVGIAIGAIALGMAVMIVAVAIVTGFQQQVRDKIVGFGGHVIVKPYNQNESYEANPLNAVDSLAKGIAAVEGVKHVQPFILKAGMFKTGDEIENIVIKGLPKNYNKEFLQSVLVEGNLITLADSAPSKQILVSKYTANRLSIKPGDDILLYFIVKNDIRKRKLTVAGITDSGFEEFDKLFAFADMRHLQNLNGWDSTQASGLEVLVNDFTKLDDTGDAINDKLPSELQAKTIKETEADIFVWLDMQDINAIIILSLMLFVAVINIISAMLVLILERTSMIGMLKAMGGTNSLIRWIFINYSSNLLMRGLIAGNILGVGLCLIQQFTGVITLPKESYYVDQVPILLNPLAIVALNLLTISASFIVLWITSLIIRRISPVKAIKLT
jgi:lipoprotein-releasing system permease protein